MNQQQGAGMKGSGPRDGAPAAEVRRSAASIGLRAVQPGNDGGWRLLNPRTNAVVAVDITAEEVIDRCRAIRARRGGGA